MTVPFFNCLANALVNKPIGNSFTHEQNSRDVKEKTKTEICLSKNGDKWLNMETKELRFR